VRKAYRWTILLLLLAVLFLAGIAFGSVSIPVLKIPAILAGGSGGAGGEGFSPALRTILVQFRLPRSLTALAAGAALAVSGLFMQTLFRNPLAGPSVLGISAGANLGVALVVLASTSGTGASLLAGLSGSGRWTLAAAAISGSLLVLLVILAASRRVPSVTVLLLFGILFGYAANSLVTLLIHFSVAERVQAYIIWTFGSFGTTNWEQLTVMLPIISVSLVASFFLAGPADIMLLGESYAGTMGVRVVMVRGAFILATALFAGTVSAFCGPVTFVGVAVPHLARGIFKASDHRTLIPASALIGSLVALSADLIARLPGTAGSLPLNAITALFGAPVVIYVLLRDRGDGGSV
jgi:iron complex transport system permease protein